MSMDSIGEYTLLVSILIIKQTLMILKPLFFLNINMQRNESSIAGVHLLLMYSLIFEKTLIEKTF